MTPLSRAYAAMEAAPDDDTARLAFFHELSASEVHVLGGETPEVFQTSDGPVILAFDSEEGLADFARAPVERASLPGRALIEALNGQGLGLTIYTDAGQTLLDPQTIEWLAEMLAGYPTETTAQLDDLEAPRDLSPDLLVALERAFARMEGLASRAWLFRSGARLVLALDGAPEGSRQAISRGLAEAVRFSDWDGTLDVTFITPEDAKRLKGRALRIDMPEPAVRPARPKDLPPRLR